MEKTIIDYAMDDNGVEFRKALYADIYDRVASHIETKKQELAQNLFNLNDEQEQEEYDDEQEEFDFEEQETEE